MGRTQLDRVKKATERYPAKRKGFSGVRRQTLRVNNVQNSVNIANKPDDNSHDAPTSVDVATSTDVNIVNKELENNVNIDIVSKRKIETLTPQPSKHITGYRIIDLEVLAEVFDSMSCPECVTTTLSLNEMESDQKGLCSNLYLNCITCGFKKHFTTSKKVLHGNTQNQNESFNSAIWEKIPKTKFASLGQLELGVYDAVGAFNTSYKSSILIFEQDLI